MRSKRLLAHQEDRVLTQLRVACGAIQDLCEENAGILPPPARSFPPGHPEDEGKAKREPEEKPAEEKPKEKEDKPADTDEDKHRVKKERTRKEKRVVKKRKKSRSREKEVEDKKKDLSEEDFDKPGRDSPDEKREEKDTFEEVVEENTEGESRKEGGKASPKEGFRYSDRVIRKKEEEAEKKEAYLREWESSNPTTPRVGDIPIRGSAGRQFQLREAIPAGDLRPPEPRDPPRRRHDEEVRGGKKERSRSRKKSKGPKQKERERDRARQWREKTQRQASWHRKPR